jgi:hypothetical protein
MTERDDEREPMIRPGARKVLWLLLAANGLAYGVFYVALHAVAVQ